MQVFAGKAVSRHDDKEEASAELAPGRLAGVNYNHLYSYVKIATTHCGARCGDLLRVVVRWIDGSKRDRKLARRHRAPGIGCSAPTIEQQRVCSSLV